MVHLGIRIEVPLYKQQLRYSGIPVKSADARFGMGQIGAKTFLSAH